MGLEEVPISPVMRDDTVTKKNPKITIRTAARKLPCVGILGTTARKMARASDPPRTTAAGRSPSVRVLTPAGPAPKPLTMQRQDATNAGARAASRVRRDGAP